MSQFSGFLLSSGKNWRIIRKFNTCYFVWGWLFVLAWLAWFFWQQTKAGATYGRVWILRFGLDLAAAPPVWWHSCSHWMYWKNAVSQDPWFFWKRSSSCLVLVQHLDCVLAASDRTWFSLVLHYPTPQPWRGQFARFFRELQIWSH